MTNHHDTQYALVSVTNKEGVTDFAKTLVGAGYEIISTGGTARALTNAGVQVTPIEAITGNPESFDGRMKTISFAVESGILFDRKNPNHVEEAEKLNIPQIDIVVSNLYPFEEAVNGGKKPSLKEAVEVIDVGGPTMIRAAAKNFENVLVVVDPKDYTRVGEAIQKKNVSEDLRKELAAKAFGRLSYYDSQIARFFEENKFPEFVTIPGKRAETLRYGENPHQEAAMYFDSASASPLKSLTRHAGRELSLMNVADVNAGLESVRFFDEPCAVVIKHNNPCGIALGETAGEALERAIAADPESAFGGVIVLNRPLDEACVEAIGRFKDERRSNIDIVAASGVDDKALATLKEIRKTMGIYTIGDMQKPDPQEMNVKFILGGFMLQTGDIDIDESFSKWEVVTKKQPTERELALGKIAWKFISRIKSNAVIVADKELPMTRGIGTGQTSRVRATKIALEQASEHTKGGILASDSFFPFDDSVRMAAEKGIVFIIEQGGSVNDKASIQAADEAGIAMVFTHRRAFWH